MSYSLSLPQATSLQPSEKSWTFVDKLLSVIVNATLVLAVSMGLFMMLAAPGQPLDFLMAGSCGAAL